jgi:hypothetical protein
MKLAEGVGCDLTLILFSLSRKLVKRFAAEPRIQPLKVWPLIVEDSPSTTNLSGLPRACGRRIFSHGEQSRAAIYGSSIRVSAECAKEARKEVDRLACVAWNQRMPGYQGPAQPSPTHSDALNAGYHYLEVPCLGETSMSTVCQSGNYRAGKFDKKVHRELTTATESS